MSQKSAAVAVAVVLLFGAGCQKHPNQAPVVTSIDGPRTVSARDSAAYACQAYDPEWRSQLEYQWSSNGGSIARETTNTVMWLTPTSSDTASVVVEVSDDSGATTRDSAVVVVLRDTVTFVPWWDGAVKQGGYVSWYDSIIAGDTVWGWTGTAADTFGDVYVMALDEENFIRWVEQGTPQVIVRQIAYLPDTFFSFRVNTTGRYRIVIDNTQGDADYDYWIRAIKVSP